MHCIGIATRQCRAQAKVKMILKANVGPLHPCINVSLFAEHDISDLPSECFLPFFACAYFVIITVFSVGCVALRACLRVRSSE